jgi:hypothetical protein
MGEIDKLFDDLLNHTIANTAEVIKMRRAFEEKQSFSLGEDWSARTFFVGPSKTVNLASPNPTRTGLFIQIMGSNPSYVFLASKYFDASTIQAEISRYLGNSGGVYDATITGNLEGFLASSSGFTTLVSIPTRGSLYGLASTENNGNTGTIVPVTIVETYNRNVDLSSKIEGLKKPGLSNLQEADLPLFRDVEDVFDTK